jgi:hypothetical protein
MIRKIIARVELAEGAEGCDMQFGLHHCYRPRLSAEIPETDVCLCSWCPRVKVQGRTYREESKKAG